MEAKALTYQQEAPKREEGKHSRATRRRDFLLLLQSTSTIAHYTRLVNEHKFATLAEN